MGARRAQASHVYEQIRIQAIQHDQEQVQCLAASCKS